MLTWTRGDMVARPHKKRQGTGTSYFASGEATCCRGSSGAGEEMTFFYGVHAEREWPTGQSFFLETSDRASEVSQEFWYELGKAEL